MLKSWSKFIRSRLLFPSPSNNFTKITHLSFSFLPETTRGYFIFYGIVKNIFHRSRVRARAIRIVSRGLRSIYITFIKEEEVEGEEKKTDVSNHSRNDAQICVTSEGNGAMRG